MTANPMVNMVKGAAIGLAAGVAVGYVGKKAVDDNPKFHKLYKMYNLNAA